MKYFVLLGALFLGACAGTPAPQPLDTSIAPQRVINKDLSSLQPAYYQKEK